MLLATHVLPSSLKQQGTPNTSFLYFCSNREKLLKTSDVGFVILKHHSPDNKMQPHSPGKKCGFSASRIFFGSNSRRYHFWNFGNFEKSDLDGSFVSCVFKKDHKKHFFTFFLVLLFTESFKNSNILYISLLFLLILRRYWVQNKVCFFLETVSKKSKSHLQNRSLKVDLCDFFTKTSSSPSQN